MEPVKPTKARIASPSKNMKEDSAGRSDGTDLGQQRSGPQSHHSPGEPRPPVEAEDSALRGPDGIGTVGQRIPTRGHVAHGGVRHLTMAPEAAAPAPQLREDEEPFVDEQGDGQEDY